MICDRELVYEALSELYSRLGQGEDLDPLQIFNSRVQKRRGKATMKHSTSVFFDRGEDHFSRTPSGFGGYHT